MKLKMAPIISAFCLVSLPLGPAFADNGGAIVNSTSIAKDIPTQLKRSQSEYYRALFQAIDDNQWDMAKNLLATAPDSPLKPIAQAELFLAPNSPKAELGPLLTLVNEAPQIPQASQLGRLAQSRGAQALPALPERRNLSYVPGTTVRAKPKQVSSDDMANGMRGQIIEFIKKDNPSGAESLLNGATGGMTSEGRAELEQRIAWSYYIENDDVSALRLARQATNGAGEWATHAEWVVGLAAWRLNDCKTASAAFEKVGRRSANAELQAAGLYWGARADMRCGHPEKVQGKLQNAARMNDSFYGLLAAQTLGMEPRKSTMTGSFGKSDWGTLERHENVRAAIALVEIGQDALADEVLRHQATIGDEQDHSTLLKLARELSLPRTQLWLAHHAPKGFEPDAQARFPAPKWTPDGGWRVDPALVYAHTLQESAFSSKAVSAANAIGLMQVRPGTASDIAKANGVAFDQKQLFHPSTNLEYGQSYLEYLGKSSITGGKLPKIVAAYNAGPGAVQRWNSEIRDNGDPLLFMESIPYVETRAYVSTILRNYWMYEQQAGITSTSAHKLSENQWPEFPKRPDRKHIQFTAR